MKEYKCVMTRGNHKVGYPAEITAVTPVIEDYEKDGWHLHTYEVTPFSASDHPVYQAGFYHFFLFEKEKAA